MDIQIKIGHIARLFLLVSDNFFLHFNDFGECNRQLEIYFHVYRDKYGVMG